MASEPDVRRRPRGSLTPDTIVVAAMDFIQGHGAANLTMTALARAMDVPVTNVHWHFRTRQELIDAVAERAAFELYSSLPEVNDELAWEEQLIETFEALRNQLLSLSTFFDLPFDQVRLLTRHAPSRTRSANGLKALRRYSSTLAFH